jgi:excisionase family DNA binding protein
MLSAAVREQDRLFLSREVSAQVLGISTRSLDLAIRDGRIEACRFGRRVLIRRDELIAFAERVSA